MDPNISYSTPFLDWMNSPIYRSSAIAVLAEFLNPRELLNSYYDTPQHRRAGFLQELLYEVCGALLDPVNGMDGLLRSGYWEHCYHAVRDIVQGKTITPLRIPNPSHQMRGSANMVVTRADEPHRSVDCKGKRPMIELDEDEPRNPSKRSCSTFERGDPSRANQSQRSQVIDPAESEPSNSKEDEISLELTLGRPDYIGKM